MRLYLPRTEVFPLQAQSAHKVRCLYAPGWLPQYEQCVANTRFLHLGASFSVSSVPWCEVILKVATFVQSNIVDKHQCYLMMNRVVILFLKDFF